MLSRNLRHLSWMLLVVLALACGGREEAPSTSAEPESPGPGTGTAKIDESKAGSVSGKVVLVGIPPKAEVIRMNADPVCMREAKDKNRTETFIVGDGGALQNVFVYVKEGLGDRTFDVPTEVVKLDQEGCRYIPHVFGIRVGQPLEIVNSDPTLHNIHAMPKKNQEFNTGQPIEGMKYTHSFTTKEVMVPFKCDVHGWMNAYAGVLDHPYFAVTGAGGTFELKTLPPGSYVIEAWHEKLPPQTQNVTVAESEEKEVNFTFKVTT
jgi:plastocyanin